MDVSLCDVEIDLARLYVTESYGRGDFRSGTLSRHLEALDFAVSVSKAVHPIS